MPLSDEDQIRFEALQGELNALLSKENEDLEGTVLKVGDDDQRMIWGWASVTTVNGEPVVDRQGDVIETSELQSAVHSYVTKSRKAGYIHQKNVAKGAFYLRKGDDLVLSGDVVDSFVFTTELQKALGINFGMEGWLVGVHVTSDQAWAEVKKGDLRSFSLGGRGVRVPIVATTEE